MLTTACSSPRFRAGYLAFASITLFLLIPGVRADADHPAVWPGFRGANVDGISTESRIFDGDSTRLEIAWKHALGGGYSSVCIADGRVVTTFSDGKSDVVAAFSAGDGRELWRVPLDETYKGHDGSKDGPLATPLIADGRVFAIAPRGKLVALDAASGKEIWKTNLVKDHGAVKPHYGFSTSPLIAEGVLIVEIGAKEEMVAGFDPQTGKRRWGVGDDTVSYQSPIPISPGGRAQVLAVGDKKLFGIDAKAGHILWESAHSGGGDRGANCIVPVPIDATHLLLKHQDDRATVVELAGADGKTTLKPQWDERSIGKSYTVPVYHDGFIYGYNGATLTCVDARTGKAAWRSREPGDGFPIIVDRHLIVATKDGGVYVANTGTAGYQQVAGLKVFDDLIWAPPSFSGGAIYVRGMNGIARINIRTGAAPAEPPRKEPAEDIAGTRFGKFLDELAGASDKPARIDKFLASVDSFPIVESDGRVVFVYRGPGEQIVVGGDLTGMGQKLTMKRVEGADLFYAAARLEPDARIGYAFVRDYKVIPDPRNPRKVIATGMDDDLELDFSDSKTEISWFAMTGWRAPTHFEPPSESHRGRMESHTFKSKALDAEITLDVYTPPGYKPDEALPVVYIHDGKTARGEMHLADALDNLIGSRMTPVIVVFINRRPPFAMPEAYATMTGEEVPAFIDGKYKTIRSRDGRAHVAFGMGGLGAVTAAFGHPDNAGKLGVQSPFIVGVGPIEPVIKNADQTPMTIYFDWCKYDVRSKLEGWSLPRFGREIDQFLRDHGYKPVGGEAHDGSGPESWKNRVDDLFETLFPLKPGK